MANNSSISICWQSDWFWELGGNINFAQYTIFLPLYATIGLFGHALCAAVFLKKAKNEKAYFYQIFLEMTGCIENILFTLFLLSFLGSGIFGGGYEWYQRNYFLMCYAAHLALPFVHSFSIACLLLNVSMAADRALALMKPFLYKNLNGKKHQIVALALSMVIGFGATLFNARLFQVQNSDNHYIIGVDLNFVDSLASTILSHICNITRMVGLLALIICNVSILRFFRKHTAQMTKSSTNDKKREARERAKENSLLLLTITQSFFTAITMISYVAFYTAAYTVPLFNECDQVVYAPLLDCVLMICDVGKTCVIVAVNRKARESFLNMQYFVKNWKHVKIGAVTTTSNNANVTVTNNRNTTLGLQLIESKL